MASAALIRWAGPAAMLGGVLWIAGAVMVARMPEGCVGAECDLPGRSMRDSSGTAPVSILAILLIGIGVAALVSQARRIGRFGTWERVGLVATAVGVGLLVGAGLVQALFFDGDFPYMPLVVIPAGLAVVIGLMLLGITILRARVVPRWAGALSIVGTLAMLGLNDQNDQAWLAIPFGIAWIGIGYALWSGTSEPPAGRCGEPG